MDPISDIFAFLESAVRSGWTPDRDLGLQNLCGQISANQQQHAGPSEAQIREVVLAAIDARFSAIDFGLGADAQFEAAVQAATAVITGQGLAESPEAAANFARQGVDIALQAYDDWMSMNGATDGDEGSRAIDAAVRAVMVALGAPVGEVTSPPQPRGFSPFEAATVSAALRASAAYGYSNDDMLLMHVLEVLLERGITPPHALSEADAQAVLDAAFFRCWGAAFAIPEGIAAAFGTALGVPVTAT